MHDAAPNSLKNVTKARLFIFFLLLGLQVSCCSVVNCQITRQQEAHLDRIATQDVPAGAPGIATGVVLDGQIVYSKCAGLEDLSAKRPISPKSRFNIASNGKQFTALAVLRLEAEGKLSLKDDIRKYFPNLYSSIAKPITIENLLTHTSGVRDIYHLWSLQGLTWWKFEFGNDDAMALLAKQQDLNFVPGQEHLYSNSNYVLLAELVEKASGSDFVSYTNAMFQQLGMPDTSFEANHATIREPIAKPYFNFQSWKGYDWLPDIVGDGALFSTLEDQLRWECLVQGAGETEFNRRLIERSQQLVNSELCTTYGFGLEFRSSNGLDTCFHAGATGAWKAFMIRYPQRKLAVVTLSNSGKTIPALQSQQMVDAMLNLGESVNSGVARDEPKGGRSRRQANESSVDWTKFEFTSINGTFINSETGAELKIDHQEGTKYSLTIKGRQTQEAKLVSTSRLDSGSYSIRWSEEFGSDATLLLNTDRVRNVRFTRLAAGSKSD